MRQSLRKPCDACADVLGIAAEVEKRLWSRPLDDPYLEGRALHFETHRRGTKGRGFAYREVNHRALKQIQQHAERRISSHQNENEEEYQSHWPYHQSPRCISCALSNRAQP